MCCGQWRWGPGPWVSSAWHQLLSQEESFSPACGVAGVARICCDSTREKFILGQCQRPLFMVFGAVDVAAHLMEPESRENWEMCQGLDSSSQGHNLNDLTETLWLCQVENEAFNGWLLPLPPALPCKAHWDKARSELGGLFILFGAWAGARESSMHVGPSLTQDLSLLPLTCDRPFPRS